MTKVLVTKVPVSLSTTPGVAGILSPVDIAFVALFLMPIDLNGALR